MRQPRSKRAGVTFIMTIGVLAGLVAILAAAAATQMVAIRSTGNRMWERRARLAAESGIQRALATLATQDPNATLQQDDWYTLGQEGDENFIVGDASFRLQIVDASGLVNINTAPEQQLQLMPLTTEQIESL